ncbi:MAG TPA: DUF4386 domain-containing protein [Puia sp.]|jgi:hypothetical protein
MASYKTKTTVTHLSQRQAALIAGVAYILVFIVAVLANFFALDKLIVPDDANATFKNIMANQSVFRFGTAGWIFVIVCDTIVAWGLYIFFRPVGRSISLITAWFRLVFVAIFAGSFVNHLSILQLVSNEDYINLLDSKQLHAQLMLSLNAQNNAVSISFVFFGIHIFFLGYLILKSGFIPRMLGILLIVASFGYIINSFGNFLSADYANNKSLFIFTVAIPGFISELSFTIWLLYQGLKRTENGSAV